MKWKPIADAPTDGREILLIEFGVGDNSKIIRGQPDYGCWGSWREDDGFGYVTLSGWMTDSGHIENPTHWLPKPEDPDDLVENDIDIRDKNGYNVSGDENATKVT